MNLFKKIFIITSLFALSAAFASCSDEQTTQQGGGHVHSFGEWSVQTEASCTEPGTEIRSCSCGESETRDILPLEHKSAEAVTENVKEATCIQPGSYDEVIYCSVCTRELSRTSRTTKKSTSHRVEDGACAECEIPESSSGLQFTLNDDGETYTLVSVGTCTDTNIVIGLYNGKSVNAIADFALKNCSEITSVTLSREIGYIGCWAFQNCAKLAYTEYEGAYYLGTPDNPYYALISATSTSIKQATVHNDARLIAGNAFIHCLSLRSVAISNSSKLFHIGKQAFYNCPNLASIDIPDAITVIEQGTFSKCGSLVSVNMSENSRITVIKSLAFSECKNLTSINIPSSVVTIDVWAFSECKNLGTVIFEKNSRLEAIKSAAFENCTALTNFYIPKNVSEIVENPFSGCSSIVAFEVDADNEKFIAIDGILYSHDMTALIAYPASAVADSFTLPESVTHLSANAFNSAQNLKYVTLNDKITSTRGAFRYCTSLVTIYLGSSVNEFGATHLEDCKSLIEINVHPDNETFASVDGNLYSKDKTVLLLYAMGKKDTSFTVPSTVTSIGKYAFGYTSLGSIYIHSDVSFVDSSAFAFAKNRFLKIYCEAAEKPEGWNSNWNPSQYTVYWGQIIN